VLVGHSKDRLGAVANRKFGDAMPVLALVAALYFLGVWFFAEKAIRRHIATIADMVRRLGRHELHTRIPKPHPRGELGVLMELLNESAQAQQQQQAAISELGDKLRQAQRLESVGQLTGGVAHDFNNLLTVILGNAELLHEQLQQHPRLAALAGMIVDAAERGADLTQRLLAFARRQALEPQAVDVNARMASLDALLRTHAGRAHRDRLRAR
jgi:signal transduction histidine kinase